MGKKLSQIAPAGSAPASTDQVAGVTGGTTDNLFTLAQVAQRVLGAATLALTPAAGSPPALTDQIVGITGGTTNNLYTLGQIAQTVLGGTSYTQGSVIFAGPGGDANLFWDNTHLALGIGTATPYADNGSLAGLVVKQALTVGAGPLTVNGNTLTSGFVQTPHVNGLTGLLLDTASNLHPVSINGARRNISFATMTAHLASRSRLGCERWGSGIGPSRSARPGKMGIWNA